MPRVPTHTSSLQICLLSLSSIIDLKTKACGLNNDRDNSYPISGECGQRSVVGQAVKLLYSNSGRDPKRRAPFTNMGEPGFNSSLDQACDDALRKRHELSRLHAETRVRCDGDQVEHAAANRPYVCRKLRPATCEPTLWIKRGQAVCREVEASSLRRFRVCYFANMLKESVQNTVAGESVVAGRVVLAAGNFSTLGTLRNEDVTTGPLLHKARGDHEKAA